jgi:mercuric ion binding protein
MKNKHLLFHLLLIFSLCSYTLKDTIIKDSFSVSGKCMMCKEKIENTAKNIEGVKSAKWNINKQSLKVKFYSKSITLEEIQQEIADIGYDTEMYQATKEAYDALHYCCKYERKKIDQ